MIITIGNFKGGVGKTTTTLLFSYLLSEKGYKVLAVDLDPQSNLTKNINKTYNKELVANKNIFSALLSNQDTENSIQSLSENLDIIAGSWDMVYFEREAHKKYYQKDHPKLLKVALSAIKDDYDFILLDTPPSTGILMENALLATDYVIIVTQTDDTDYDSTKNFYEYLVDRNNDESHNFQLLGVLPYLVGRSATDEAIFEEYKNVFETELFTNYIRTSARVKTWNRKGITENQGHDKVTLAMYNDIVEEALERVGVK